MGYNLYAYCENNAVSNIDSSGNVSFKVRAWGYEFYLDKRDATLLTKIFSTCATIATFVEFLNTALPEPIFSKTVAAAIWLFGFSAQLVRTLVDNANSKGSKGIIMKFV